MERRQEILILSTHRKPVFPLEPGLFVAAFPQHGLQLVDVKVRDATLLKSYINIAVFFFKE